MAYTGVAYINTLPADEWIAERLVGNIERCRGGPAVFSFRRIRHWRDAGSVLNATRDALNQVSALLGKGLHREQWDENDFAVSAVGWMWNRKRRARAFAAVIVKDAGSTQCELYWMTPRIWEQNQGVLTVAPRFSQLEERLRELSAVVAHPDPNVADALIVNAIRDSSRILPHIGPDVLTVYLPQPQFHYVGVRFTPLKPLVVTDRITNQPRDVSFAPWIIGPGGTIAPTMFHGCQPCVSIGGHFRIELKTQNQQATVASLFFVPHLRRPSG